MVRPIDPAPAVVRIEHPVGTMEVTVDYERANTDFRFRSAGVVRTARLIARGEVMIPRALGWSAG